MDRRNRRPVPVMATYFSVRRGRDAFFKFYMKTLFARQVREYEKKFGIRFIDLDKFDRSFLRRSAAFCSKNGAVPRATEIAVKREFGVDNLAFPLFPGFGHNAPSSA